MDCPYFRGAMGNDLFNRINTFIVFYPFTHTTYRDRKKGKNMILEKDELLLSPRYRIFKKVMGKWAILGKS
jgi:hypothetical protein